MDDALLMSVLDGVTNLQKKLEALLNGKFFAVAKIRDALAANQFHHEKRTTAAGDARVEHARDVRMIHQSQRLPLGLKARDDRTRVHAELDDLDGHFAPERRRLRGAINDTTAAFADFFENLVARKRIGFARRRNSFFGFRSVAAFQAKFQQAAQAQAARHVRRERRAALRTFGLDGHFSSQQVSKAKRAQSYNPTDRLSVRQNRKQVTDFCFHLVGPGHGVGNFLAQPFAKPPAQPMQGNFERAGFHAKLRGEARVIARCRFAGQMRLQRLKHGLPPARGVFSPEIFHDAAHQRYRPAAFKQLVWRAGIFRFLCENFLGVFFIQRNNDMRAAAFGRRNMVVMVVQKI